MSTYIRLVFLFVFSFSSTTLLTSRDLAAQVIVGNCNIYVNDIQVREVVLRTNDYYCGSTADKQKSLRVSYFWLDSVSTSLLLNGRIGRRLEQIVGPNPILLKTAAGDVVDNLIKQFGIAIEDTASDLASLDTAVGDDTIASIDDDYKSPLVTYRPVDELSDYTRRIKVFGGERDIYLPDINAIRTIHRTPYWPSNYRLTASHLPAGERESIENILQFISTESYSEEDIAAQLIMPRLFMSRPANRADIENYRKNIDLVRSEAMGVPRFTSVPPTVLPFPDDNDSDAEQKKFFRLLERQPSNLSLEATKFFTKDGMPENFLRVLGEASGHGGTMYDWGFRIMPRKLYVQVAVIKNVSTPPTTFSIDTFNILESEETGLRVASLAQPDRERKLTYPPVSFSPNETIVVPLTVELRDNEQNFTNAMDQTDFSSNFAGADPAIDPETAEYHDDLLSLIKSNTLRFFLSEKSTDTIRSNRLHARPPANPVFVFGRALTLSSVSMDGEEVGIRSYDPNRLYSVAGFDGASCPIMYFKYVGESELTRRGSILQKAIGKKSIETIAIVLPREVEEVTLSEEEPEQTFFEFVELWREDAGRQSELIERIEQKHLDFGQQLKIRIPHSDSQRLFLRIRGYYTPYSALTLWK